MRVLVLGVLLALAGCDDDSLAGIGQPCSSSGECASGLVCDFTRKPHTCQPNQNLTRDLSVPPLPDGAVADLSTQD